MKRSLPIPWGTHLERRGAALAVLIAMATLLELAAVIGLSYVAGFGNVREILTRFDAVWLLVVVGALLVSFIGYYQVYQGVFRVEGGPRLSWRHMIAVVAAGFGGFLCYNGGALDAYALRSAGAGETEAKARAAALAGLEHGVLAIGGTVTAIIVLAAGLDEPNPSYTLPWAIIPIPGLLIAFWLAERYRGRFYGKSGLVRRLIGIFLESIHLIRVLFAHPLRWGAALAGMALFWAAEAFAAWAGLAAFGFHMDAAALFVGFATGMVFTRRTGPLAGAGVLALLLPLTLLVSGAPLAVAVVGVFWYRLLALWLPLPVSLAVLATLRKLPELAEPPGGHGEAASEPPASPAAPAGQAAVTEVIEPAAPGPQPAAPAARPAAPTL